MIFFFERLEVVWRNSVIPPKVEGIDEVLRSHLFILTAGSNCVYSMHTVT